MGPFVPIYGLFVIKDPLLMLPSHGFLTPWIWPISFIYICIRCVFTGYSLEPQWNCLPLLHQKVTCQRALWKVTCQRAPLKGTISAQSNSKSHQHSQKYIQDIFLLEMAKFILQIEISYLCRWALVVAVESQSPILLLLIRTQMADKKCFEAEIWQFAL